MLGSSGYVAESPVDDEFVAVWRVAQALMDMTVIATWPEYRTEVQAHLARLFGQW